MSMLHAEFFSAPELELDPNPAMICCEVLVTKILSTKQHPLTGEDISFAADVDFESGVKLKDNVDILLVVTVTGTKKLRKEAKLRAAEITSALQEVYGPQYDISVSLDLIFEFATVNNRKKKLPNLTYDPLMVEGLDETFARICTEDGITLLDEADRVPILTS